MSEYHSYQLPPPEEEEETNAPLIKEHVSDKDFHHQSHHQSAAGPSFGSHSGSPSGSHSGPHSGSHSNESYLSFGSNFGEIDRMQGFGGKDNDESIRRGLLYSFLALQSLFWISSLLFLIYLAIEGFAYFTLGVCAANLALAPLGCMIWLFGNMLQLSMLKSILKTMVFVVGVLMSAYFGGLWFYAFPYIFENFSWYFTLAIVNWFFASLVLAVLIGHFDKFELLFGDCWKDQYLKLKNDLGPPEWNFQYQGGNMIETGLVAADDAVIDSFETSTLCCLCIEDGVSEINVTKHRVVAVETNCCFPCCGTGQIVYSSYWNKDQGQMDIRSYPNIFRRLLRIVFIIIFLWATVCPWIVFLPLIGACIMRQEFVYIGHATTVTPAHTISRRDVPRFRTAYLKSQRIWRA